MRTQILLSTLLGLSVVPALTVPALAQEKGTIEIGAFAKFTAYDKSFGTSRKRENSWGGGGRLGYFFSKHWELEADGSGNATDVKEFFDGYVSTALTYYPFHLRLNYNQRLGDSPFTWIIGVGPGYNRYGKNVAGIPGFRGDGFGSDWGVSGLTGVRIMLTNWLAARFDGTLDYIPSPNNGKAALVAQGTGLEASTIPTKNTNVGFQAGLSLMLGMCNRSKDGTTISPSSANIKTGESASFSATATNCGRPDQVVYTVSGPGTIDATGHYTAAGPGTATITACGKKNKLCSTATVTVAPPEPPKPPRTLTRCELNPTTSQPRIDQPVAYTVTLYYSDGTTETLNNPTLTSTGGTVSGSSVSWSTPGAKTVTVTCGTGVTGTATADVQRFLIVVRDSAYFQYNKTVIYRQEDQVQLNAIAKVLIEHPDIRLVIDGHADADGTVKYNEGLAMNRAISLKTYLGKQGAPVDRMTIVLRSFGECVPVEPNNTDAGRRMNRRAELREFGNEQPGPGNAVCPEAGRERKP